jgi:hypothetical protein
MAPFGISEIHQLPSNEAENIFLFWIRHFTNDFKSADAFLKIFLYIASFITFVFAIYGIIQYLKLRRRSQPAREDFWYELDRTMVFLGPLL